MKSRIRTWEIILTGCLFSAIGIYLLAPAQNSNPNPHSQSIKLEAPQPPEAPEIPKSIIIHLEKVEKKLQKMERLKNLKDLKKVEQELKKVEKELESTSIQLENISLPSLKGLPEVLIHSH